MSGQRQQMATVTYLVTGMSCDHCARAVAGELRSLDGVSDVTVQLVPGGLSPVTVVSAPRLTAAAVAAALQEAGAYQVTDSS